MMANPRTGGYVRPSRQTARRPAISCPSCGRDAGGEVPSVLAVNKADLQDRWSLQGGDEAMTVAEGTAVRVDVAGLMDVGRKRKANEDHFVIATLQKTVHTTVVARA